MTIFYPPYFSTYVDCCLSVHKQVYYGLFSFIVSLNIIDRFWFGCYCLLLSVMNTSVLSGVIRLLKSELFFKKANQWSSIDIMSTQKLDNCCIIGHCCKVHNLGHPYQAEYIGHQNEPAYFQILAWRKKIHQSIIDKWPRNGKNMHMVF